MLTGWATWDTATLNARITVGKRAFFMNEKCEISLFQYNSQEVIDVWSEGRCVWNIEHLLFFIWTLPDWSATDKTMDSECLEGHEAAFQVKTTYLLTH